MRLNFVDGDEGYGTVSNYYKARVILSTMMIKIGHGRQYLNNTYSVSNWSDDIII